LAALRGAIFLIDLPGRFFLPLSGVWKRLPMIATVQGKIRFDFQAALQE
jgi:hypothetical protein